MGTATILVVDDERKIRDLVRSYLELEGYSVLVADSGERALESCMGSETAIMRLTCGFAAGEGDEPGPLWMA
jgi:DNA-binding response OmpR family regulator